ncbi:MAG: hypothetical protein AAF288_13135 [Planctomycetota bacterium]
MPQYAAHDISANRLTQTRGAVHWATQALSATQDTLLPKTPDDAQSNLAWDDCRGLVGRPLPDGSMLGLRLVEPAVLLLRDGAVIESFALPGQTIDALFQWINQTVPGLGEARTATPPDYDMPDHPYGTSSAVFEPDADALAYLAQALSTGHNTLARFADDHDTVDPPRLWPHHFDFGALWLPSANSDAQNGPSIGLGFAPGDAGVDTPYFYVNPYGLPDNHHQPPDLTRIADAEPAPSWTGVILRAPAALDTDAAHRFLNAAVDAYAKRIREVA